MTKTFYLIDSNREILEKLYAYDSVKLLINPDILNEEFFSMKKGDVKVEVLVNVFSDKGEKFLDSAKAVEATEREVVFNGLQGFCPNNEDFRSLKLNEIKGIIKNKNVDGLLLSFCHFPTNYFSPEVDLFDTCYCSTCIEKFRKEHLFGEVLPEKLTDLFDAIDGQYYLEWLEFKCKTMTSFISEIKQLAEERENFTIGLVIPSWKDKDYGSALTRILGLNYYELDSLVSYISPTLFYKLYSQDISLVDESLDYFKSFNIKVVPSLFYTSEISSISASELSDLFNILRKNGSEDIIIWDTVGVLNNKELEGIFKSL